MSSSPRCTLPPAAAWAHISRRLGPVRPGFLLYVGGADFRKNLEGMIAGFGRLPANLRAQHQLVIAGILNPGQADILRREARPRGHRARRARPDRPRERLRPRRPLSRLPPVRVPVVVRGIRPADPRSDGVRGAGRRQRVRRSVPEVLGDLEGTFDPHDPDSIASCLAEILTSQDAARSAQREVRSAAVQSSPGSASPSDRSKPTSTRVLASPSHGVAGARRARLAMVTPWPPDQTRVADYGLATRARARATRRRRRHRREPGRSVSGPAGGPSGWSTPATSDGFAICVNTTESCTASGTVSSTSRLRTAEAPPRRGRASRRSGSASNARASGLRGPVLRALELGA